MNANVLTHSLSARVLQATMLALLCVGCNLLGGDPAQENLKRLNAQIEELSRIPPREQLTDQPYIKGRALVVTKRQDSPYPGMEYSYS